MRCLVPALLVLAFTIYCVVDVIRSEQHDVRGLPKPLWVVLVLLFPLAGGAAWFIAGRPRGSRPPGTDRLTRPRPRVLGPDDDPDFLRTIDRPRPVDRPPRPPDAPRRPRRPRHRRLTTRARRPPAPRRPHVTGPADRDGRRDRRPSGGRPATDGHATGRARTSGRDDRHR